MKKTTRILSLCLALILMASLLAACSSNSEFVGTWKEEGSDTKLVLASDGSGSVSEQGVSGSVKWNVEGDKVFITVSICGMSETDEYTYEFSGDTMTLTENNGNTTVYTKVK